MILMKSFLYARNLNTNYKGNEFTLGFDDLVIFFDLFYLVLACFLGGISSYCLLIMIIAFFRDNHALS